MDKYDTIIEHLRNGENFAIARFNDGEMMGVERAGALVARGDQVVSPELHEKLIAALKHEQERYWIGLPCAHCFPKYQQLASSMVRADYPYTTKAVVLINNGHWQRFLHDFSQTHRGREIVWVSGDDQNLEGLKKNPELSELNIVQHLKVPARNGWSAYESISSAASSFKSDSIVIMSCGPMSRVLAAEWFQQRPDCTFIDAGSIFDPFTRNVRHRVHTNTLPRCEGCHRV